MSRLPEVAGRVRRERVVELNEDRAVVAYQTRAVRNGTEYSALINSTYVRRGGTWKLAVHQQTPL